MPTSALRQSRLTATASFIASELPGSLTLEQTLPDPDEYIRLALHFYDYVLRDARRAGTSLTTRDRVQRWLTGDTTPLPIGLEGVAAVTIYLFDRGNGERLLTAAGAERVTHHALEAALLTLLDQLRTRLSEEDFEFLTEAIETMNEGYDWDEALADDAGHDVPNHAFFSTIIESTGDAERVEE